MIQPLIKEIESLDLLSYDKIVLANGLPVYFINAGKQALIKIDVLFEAGNVFSENPVLPGAVNALLNDGTVNFNSQQIAELIDGKGAFYMPDVQNDFSQVSLYLLNKFTKDLLPLLVEMINNSVFPQEEIEMYKRNMKQRFLVEYEKVNVQSYQHFNNALFGSNSIYADNTKAADYDHLQRDSIQAFYNDRVKKSPSHVIVSGMIDEKVRKEVIANFESFELKNNIASDRVLVYGDVAPKEDWIKIPGADNNQVSLRIGSPTITFGHEDYWGLSLLSTILGGYFGSRLNKVLREEKGLTYGVHGHITHLKHADYLSIHAELNAANWEEAYDSILDVFNDLKSNLIDASELEMVRRYIKGNLLQSLDGAFLFSTYLRNSLIYSMEDDRVNQYINYLDKVHPDDLIKLSEQYLNENNFYKIVAGV